MSNSKVATEQVEELKMRLALAAADSMGGAAFAALAVDELEQAIAATLWSEHELIDLAHNAWSMALCAMQGMPIPADWGNAVEHGLRKYGINVDEELAGFEVIDE